MERARVGLFEDHDDMRKVIAYQLKSSGHRVVLEADSLKKALEAIDNADPDSIDVAIVDADLGVGPSEGAEVVKKLRENLGSTAIIGISILEPPEGADIKISKFRLEEIIDYINSL